MPFEVFGPDGKSVTFPDGTDNATVMRVMGGIYPSRGGAAPAAEAEDPLAKPRQETTSRIKQLQADIARQEEMLKKPLPGGSAQAIGLQKSIESAKNTIGLMQNRLQYMEQTKQAPPEPTVGSVVSDIVRGPLRAAAASPGQVIGGLAGWAGSGLSAAGAKETGSDVSKFGSALETGAAKFGENLFGGRSEATKFSPGAQFAAEAGEAVGSVAPFIFTEGIAGLAGRATQAGRAAIAAGQVPKVTKAIRAANYPVAAGLGSDQAGQQIEQFREKGGVVTPTQEFFARLGGAGLGLTEVGVVNRMIERVPVSARGKAIDAINDVVTRATAGRVAPQATMNAIKDTIHAVEQSALGRIGLSAAEEAGQEAFSQFGQNVLAQQIYNPKQELSEGVSENALLGAIAGGTVRGGAEAVQRVIGPRPALKQEQLPLVSPEVQAEFRNLASQRVATIMAANPDLTRDQAVEKVLPEVDALLEQAKTDVEAAQTQGEGLGGAGSQPDVDVAGAAGPSVPSAGVTATAEENAQGAAPAEPVRVAGTGEPAGGVATPEAGAVDTLTPKGETQTAEEFYPDLMPAYTAETSKAKMDAVRPVVSDIFARVTGIDISNPKALPTNTQKALNTATQKVHAAVKQNAAIDPEAVVQEQMAAFGVTPAAPTPEVVTPAAKVAPKKATPAPKAVAPTPVEAPLPEGYAETLQAYQGLVDQPTPQAMDTLKASTVRELPTQSNLTMAVVPAPDGKLMALPSRDMIINWQRSIQGEPGKDLRSRTIDKFYDYDGPSPPLQVTRPAIVDANGRVIQRGTLGKVAPRPAPAAAKSAPQVKTDEQVAVEEKKKLLGRMKKAPGKTARQKLIAIMAEEQEKELKGKSPEEVAEALGVSPFDPQYDELVGRAGVNRQRMVQAQVNKYKGNPSEMTAVVAKELLQNSHDATRTAMERGQIKQGRVQFNISKDGRTITIKDNGQGMTGEILAGPFLELGSTGKGEGKHSGGFGLAKALLLYSSEKIDVITARDGKVSTLDTTGEQLHEAAYSDDSSLQPRIQRREFTEDDYALFPEGHGTIVQLRMPEKDIDPRTGQQVEVEQLPTEYNSYSRQLKGLINSPLFANTKVTYNGDIVPVGSEFPLDDFRVFGRVKLPFGIAHVYVSKDTKEYNSQRKVRVLSDGVWQFDVDVKTSNGEKLPHEFFVNIIPFDHVKPDSALYPFNEQRKNFSDGGQSSFNKLAGLLQATFGVRSFLNDVKSFGNIQYYNPTTGAPSSVIDLTPELPSDVLRKLEANGVADNSAIEIGEDGRVVVNGSEVDTDSVEDLQKALPKANELIIDQSLIYPDHVMLHDAADIEIYNRNTYDYDRKPVVDYMREKFGSRVDGFFNLVGSRFLELRAEVVKVMNQRYPGAYDALLNEAIGVSLDPRYRGVSIKVPFAGMFINPLVPESTDPYERLEGIVTTMIHELAHYKVRSHDALFPAEMQRIYAALKAAKYKQGFNFNAWTDRFIDDVVNNDYQEIIDAGQYLFATEEDRESGIYSYSDPYYKNARVVYRSGRLGDGSTESIPERGAEGEGATSDVGDTGARGAGSEQLLGPTYDRRGGAGGGRNRGAGKENAKPVTNAAVDKAVSVKLTKAQIQKLEEAAGIQRMQLTEMQKRIARSRNAAETTSLAGKLMMMARHRGEDSGLFVSLFNSMPTGVFQVALAPQMTEDVVRIANLAGLNNVQRIDNLMRDEYLPYVNRMMLEASETAEKLADFVSRTEPGADALADIIFYANMLRADPSRANSATEYLKIDPKYRELQTQLTAATDPAERKSITQQMTARRGEIQRLYGGGKDPKTGETIHGWNDLSRSEFGGGAGKQVFRMLRDHYKKTLKEHYRLAMQRIDDSELSEEDAETLKARIDDMFAEAMANPFYFPLKRFGDYWVSVGKGKGSDFHMFESAAAQQAFMRELEAKKENRPISSGYGRDSLLSNIATKDASKALKEILDLVRDTGIIDPNVLEDHILQMYLTALPEADMRRRFIHREFKAGFSTDVLRVFASTSIASANQLGRLAFSRKFDNLISAGFAETEGNPLKGKLDTLTREMALRIKGTLSPDPTNWLDTLNSIGAKATFYFLLSSPKTAAMNLTQLHMVGLPVLSAEFGEAATTAMSARYTATLLNDARLGTPFRDEDGNVKLQMPKLTLENSARLREMKKSDPERYAQTMKAWRFAAIHDITQSTYSANADMYERSNKPSKNFTARQAFRRGDMVTAAQRATANTIQNIGVLFHTTERVGREIMYMSAFDLAYERAIKQGKTPKQAGAEAMEMAHKLTNKAMFDFSTWNKSRAMKSKAGRLPLQMLAYIQSMSSLLFRSFFRMLPFFNKQGKLAAARVFFGTNAMAMLYGGMNAALFMPLALAAYGLYQGLKNLLGDDDEEKEVEGDYLTEKTLRDEMLKYADEHGHELAKKDMEFYIRSEWIPQTFGPGGTLATALDIGPAAAAKLAKAADMGLPAMFDVDISKSVALGDLWHPTEVKSDDPEVAFYEWLGRHIGPVGTVITTPARVVNEVNKGNFDKAFEVSLPSALRNVFKAQRLQDEGLLIGKNRDIMLRDPSFYDTYTTFMQSMGFPEADTSRDMQLDMAAGAMEEEIGKEATTLLDRRYSAVLEFNRDPTDKNLRAWKRVERAIDIYNLNYPSNAITLPDMDKSFKNKSKMAAERAFGLGYNAKIPVRQPLAEQRAAETGRE